MIENDPVAKKHINDLYPLALDQGAFIDLSPVTKAEADVVGTLKLLKDTSEGLRPDRKSDIGVTDIYRLLNLVPFNFDKHIRSGTLTTIVNLPGKDGRTVWEASALKMKFALI